MEKFPSRGWGIILQQAWTFKMRSKTNSSWGDRPGSIWSKDQSKAGSRNPRRDICWKFNTGKYTYGIGCKFEHKCALCLKFRHRVHNCRKANNDQDRRRLAPHETSDARSNRYDQGVDRNIRYH